MHPPWAPRVRKSDIARLYASEGRGVLDEVLVDDVGQKLLQRCESSLVATEASRGRVRCPRCRRIIRRRRDKGEVLTCVCGWTTSWIAYRDSYKKRRLFAGGMEPFFRDFVRQFPEARTPREKMILIDQLIHRWHWERRQQAFPHRSGAVNLVAGTVREVVEFLDRLSSGTSTSDHVRRALAAWRGKRDREACRWRCPCEKRRGL